MGRAKTGRKTGQEKLLQPWDRKLTENERAGQENEIGETFQAKGHDLRQWSQDENKSRAQRT